MEKRSTGGHFVTPEHMRNAKRNIERFPWAASQRDAAVARAERWIGLEDESLWGLVTEQAIGRSTNASVEKGCPRCGDGINRLGGSFRVDVLADPWKITCPNCEGRFPTNDLGAFYRSGKGADSFFDPAKADRSLLYNTDHPDPADPAHLWGVDDGTGWIDDAGESFKLVGVYGHYGVWSEVSTACRGLTEAFLLTGEPVYAHKAGILLARIADVYPAMDWSHWSKLGFFNSDGLSGRGRIYGRIWEPGLLVTFTQCYDAVRLAWSGGDTLFEFLAEKQSTLGLPPQATVRALCEHFEEHVIREGIQAIVKGDVCRNEPGDQVTMAVLAVALDSEETDGWLDWIFREGLLRGQTPNGGHIPQLFAKGIDRDGVGSEAAPSYSLGWLYKAQGMNDLDRTINARPGYTNHSIRDFGRYRQMFLAHIRMLVLGRYVPPIGDTGKTGAPSLCGLTVEQCLEGFELFGDPVFAQAAYHLSDGDALQLHGSIYAAEPDAISSRVRDVIAAEGTLRLEADLMTGYGLALLRDGEADHERTLWLYYGRNTGHGHADRLNLGLHGFGLDLLPDLGYPEHARVWPKRSGWTNHTVSHNTVLIDRSAQKGSYSGKVHFFARSPVAQVISIRSPDVYDQCSVYERCSALIRISEQDFYVVDLFRVVGGTTHHLLFHAAEGEITTHGLRLTPQERGTYAGEDISFGQFYDGEVRGYRGSGFQYLYDVQRCAHPDPVASVDWRIKDTWQVTPRSEEAGEPTATDIRLRWTLLGAPGEVSICKGDPPANKPGNPEWLRYAVAAHEGDAPLESGYLSVIEAYSGRRAIKAVTELELAGESGRGCRALKVQLPSGGTDTVFFGDGETRLSDMNGTVFDGLFGFCRCEASGEVSDAFLAGGTELGGGPRKLACEEAVWEGAVAGREDGVIMTRDLPPQSQSLTGSYITVRNNNERDACYRIGSVSRQGDLTRIEVGENDFARGMVDELDYAKGLLYDFEPGDAFQVITSSYRSWG